MLSLRKKSDATAPSAAAWHTNFRNFERLPDTKAVRTSFFVNGGAIFAALAMLLFVAYREYDRKQLADQVAQWEETIAASKSASAAAVARYQKFVEEEKKISEVANFVDAKLVFSDFMLRLAEGLPTEIALNYIEYRGTGVTVRGTVRGAPNEASARASDYVGQLQTNPDFKERFESITLTSLAREAGTGDLQFEAQMKFPVPQTKSAAKKKKTS